MVNAQSTRRAKRRDIRTQYLLDAYRSIEAASNRPMDSGAARELEAALADVQLLGTAAQVAAAHRFAEDFASNGGADTGPILNELHDKRARISTWARCRTGAPTYGSRWAVSKPTSNGRTTLGSAQRRSLLCNERRHPRPRPRWEPRKRNTMHQLLDATSAWEGLQSALADNLEAIGVSVGSLGLDDQLNVASERGLISEKTRKGIAGLNVMWSLLSHDARDGRRRATVPRSSSCWPQPSAASSTPASQDQSSSSR